MATFHPELTADTAVHSVFPEAGRRSRAMCGQWRKARDGNTTEARPGATLLLQRARLGEFLPRETTSVSREDYLKVIWEFAQDEHAPDRRAPRRGTARHAARRDRGAQAHDPRRLVARRA